LQQTKGLSTAKNIYFASDLHLGAPSHQQSLAREKLFVKWLESIKPSCEALYLLGDVFDFWFEYKKVIPKGYVRLLGKLAEFTDQGIPVYLMKGNHDLWLFDYLEKEINVKIIEQPLIKKINNKTFYLAHGDGLGPKQYTFKIVRKFFLSNLCQWCFARLHPNLAISLGEYLSQRSRKSHKSEEDQFMGEEKEYILLHSKKILTAQHIDYFIYGHRHLAMVHMLTQKSTYINLGDWIRGTSYAVFDGKELSLESFN